MNVSQIPRQVFGGAAKKAVNVYQDYISADYNGERGAHCMYTPSCSAFMKEAVEQEGILQGSMSGLMRLKRCSNQELEKRLQQFVMQMVMTPKDQIGARFGVEDKAALDKLGEVHGYLQQMQVELAKGNKAGAQQINDQWVHVLRDELRVLVEEHPDTDPSAPPRFKVIHNRPWIAPEKVELGRVAQGAVTTGGVTAGLLGGLAGMVGFGLVGMAYGGFRATNAGLGQNGSLEASWGKKYGSSAQGSALDKKIAGWHESLSKGIGGVAASVVLGPVGFVAGIAAGLYKGGKLGIQEGWHGGSILGRNLTRDLVDGHGDSHRHPAGCGCGCQAETKASQAAGLPSVPMAGSKAWTLIGHLDATSRELEPMRTRQVVDFERFPHQDAHVVLQMRREGKDIDSLKRSSFVKTFVKPALLVGAGVAAGLMGLSGLPLVLVGSQLGTLAAMSVFSGLKDKQVATRVGEAHVEGSWSGTRTYELAAGGVYDAAKRSIQTPSVERSRSSAAPQAQELSDLWVRSMKRYPSEHTAILIEGHGLGYKRLAGMKMNEVGKALELTHDQTGKKVDVLVLEACEMANLEALKDLGAHARYAIVSQDSLWEAGLPWSYIMPRLHEIDKDPKTFGEMIVKRHGGNEVVPTLSLIDLEKLPALATSVEALAAKVSEKMPAMKAHFAAAADGTRHFPQAEHSETPGAQGKLENAWLGLKRFVNAPGYGDLGSFLAKLAEGCPDAEVEALARDCSAKLAEAVVVNRCDPKLGEASGLSIQMPDPIMFPKQYVKDTGMANWGSLIHGVRPWRTRVACVAVEGLHTGLTTVAPGAEKWDLLNRL